MSKESVFKTWSSCRNRLAVRGSCCTVELRSPATLNGKELPAGTYKISWTGEGSNVKVTFANGKKFTMETPGKFVERETQAVDDGVVSRKNGSGSLEISEVRFGGEKRVLVLGS